MKQHFLLLISLLILSLFLRTVQLDTNPAGFFRDEADKGYTSFCLIQTGQDQTGKPYPLFVRSLQVTTSALYQYVDIPFILLFGLNEFAVRLPAAIAGTLSVLAVYLIARAWWNPSAALWAGLFVCLSPWSLLLSRWANQSILLTVSIPFAVYFFSRMKNQVYPNLLHTIFSSSCFLVALYTYAPARLFVPVFAGLAWIASLVFVYQQRNSWKPFMFSAIAFWCVFAIGSVPLAYHLMYESAESGARFSNITIMRGQPLIEITQEWLHNYFLHLSPGFLFVYGDENLRHNTAVFGQLQWYLLPLLLLGFYRSIRIRRHVDCILLVWFLCFPIAAAMTSESIPHALRSVFAVPVAQLIAAYGMMEFYDLSNTYTKMISHKLRNALMVIWVSSVILLSGIYLYDLFVRYPVYSSPHWEYGYKQAISWLQENRKPGERVVVSGIAEYPQWFFLFYDQVDPAYWIEHHSIEGITFVPTGHDITPYYEQSPEAKTYYLLRPFELQNLGSAKSILAPQEPGTLPNPVWKIAVSGE